MKSENIAEKTETQVEKNDPTNRLLDDVRDSLSTQPNAPTDKPSSLPDLTISDENAGKRCWIYPDHFAPYFKTPDFATESKAVISKLDSNNDGALSKKELENGIASENTLSKTEFGVAKTMLSNYKELSKLNKDGNTGVTELDIDAYAHLQRQQSKNEFIANKVSEKYGNESEFQELDRDHDNYISKDELQAAYSNERDWQTRRDLAFMMDNYKQMMKSSNDEFGFENNGISLADLKNYPQKMEESKEAKLVSGIRGDMSELAYPVWPKPPIWQPNPIEPHPIHPSRTTHSSGRPLRNS